MTCWNPKSTSLRAAMLLSLALVSACQVQIATTPGGKAGDPRPKTSTSPAIKASASPKASPSVAPSAQPAPDLLIKPAAPGAVLSGQVQIDAHYLLGIGKGKLIGQAGGNLIGQAGGNVIAVGGGNLIGQAGGNLIGQAGGNIIASDAANLIGQAGGNLIGKRKYETLQADPAMAVGTVLPAAEMLIQVVSMATGKPLPLGKDKAGQDVYGVYTDAAGAYEIYLPAGIEGKNVLVVALPPDYLEDRLNYQVVRAVQGTGDVLVDEDTALVSDYLREAFASRLERMFLQAEMDLAYLPDALRGLLKERVVRLKAAADESNLASKPPEQVRARAIAAVDRLLAFIELENLKLADSDAKMMDVLRAMMKEMRQKAGAKMAANPKYFEEQAYIAQANAERTAAGLPPYEIKKPTDLADYVRRRILTDSDRKRLDELDPIFASVEMGSGSRHKLNQAMDALLLRIGITIATDEAAFQAAQKAVAGGE